MEISRGGASSGKRPNAFERVKERVKEEFPRSLKIALSRDALSFWGKRQICARTRHIYPQVVQRSQSRLERLSPDRDGVRHRQHDRVRLRRRSPSVSRENAVCAWDSSLTVGRVMRPGTVFPRWWYSAVPVVFVHVPVSRFRACLFVRTASLFVFPLSLGEMRFLSLRRESLARCVSGRKRETFPTRGCSRSRVRVHPGATQATFSWAVCRSGATSSTTILCISARTQRHTFGTRILIRDSDFSDGYIYVKTISSLRSRSRSDRALEMFPTTTLSRDVRL